MDPFRLPAEPVLRKHLYQRDKGDDQTCQDDKNHQTHDNERDRRQHRPQQRAPQPDATREHLAGIKNHSHVLWSLIMFEKWRSDWLETGDDG